MKVTRALDNILGRAENAPEHWKDDNHYKTKLKAALGTASNRNEAHPNSTRVFLWPEIAGRMTFNQMASLALQTRLSACILSSENGSQQLVVSVHSTPETMPGEPLTLFIDRDSWVMGWLPGPTPLLKEKQDLGRYPTKLASLFRDLIEAEPCGGLGHDVVQMQTFTEQEKKIPLEVWSTPGSKTIVRSKQCLRFVLRVHASTWTKVFDNTRRCVHCTEARGRVRRTSTEAEKKFVAASAAAIAAIKNPSQDFDTLMKNYENAQAQLKLVLEHNAVLETRLGEHELELNPLDTEAAVQLTASVTNDTYAHGLLTTILDTDRSGDFERMWICHLETIRNVRQKNAAANVFNEPLLHAMLRIYVRSPSAARVAGESGLLAMAHSNTLDSYLKPFDPEMGFTVKLEAQMDREREKYQRFKNDLWEKSEGCREPCGQGMVTVDEIMIKGHVLMRTKDQSVVGWVLNHDQLSSLDNMYEDLHIQDPPKARYVMCSMWGDLDSNYNFLGPMVASGSGLTGRQLDLFFWEMVRVFSRYGFETHLCILNGAGPNLKFVCLNSDVTNEHTRPWTYNPYTRFLLFFIFDPDHMIKNMRNAIFSSRACVAAPRHFSISKSLLLEWWPELQRKPQRDLDPNRPSAGSKLVEDPTPTNLNDRVHFGFDEVLLVHKQETGNVRLNNYLVATGRCLTNDVVTLDGYTKMRVHLAQYFFKDPVVAMFKVTSRLLPSDPKWQALTHIMEACNLIFLRFFGISQLISSFDEAPAQRLLCGFNFFRSWRADWRAWAAISGLPKQKTDRHFLSARTSTEVIVF
jgi:hypothetical protein